MSDAEEESTRSPREPTMRRTVRALNDDRLHKGMNWTTLVGVAATAALGYFADAKRGESDDRLATGVARELAVIQAWKDGAEADLRAQTEQIARLREAVAALKVANEVLIQGYGGRPLGARLRAATEDVGELLDAAPSPRAAGAPGAPDVEREQALKRGLLGE